MNSSTARALLFYSAADRPDDWLPELGRLVPGLGLRVWPETGPVEEIRYALVWKPPPGLLAGLPGLEVVFSLGAGVDALLADPSLPDRPLVRLIEPGLTEGMTEYVVLQVLRHHRRMDAYREQQRAGVWRQLPQRLAREVRVGVLGLGVLGAAAARALAALGFQVAGWSRRPAALPGIEGFAGPEGLEPFLRRSEILVCLLPLTPETQGLIDRRLLSLLPRDAVLVNAARGGHVVEADLLEALDTGQIAAATLDVFETEPLPPDHPFWHHPKIILTPHVAALTHARTAAAFIAEQIRRFEAGLPLDAVVDRERGY